VTRLRCISGRYAGGQRCRKIASQLLYHFGEYIQPGEIVPHVYTKEVKPYCALCFYGRRWHIQFKARPAFCLKKRVQLESARKAKGSADAEQYSKGL